MKESTLLEMKNKIDAMTTVVQQLINEVTHLRELSIGTLETIKRMPGYKEAVAELTEELTKEKDKDVE